MSVLNHIVYVKIADDPCQEFLRKLSQEGLACDLLNPEGDLDAHLKQLRPILVLISADLDVNVRDDVIRCVKNWSPNVPSIQIVPADADVTVYDLNTIQAAAIAQAQGIQDIPEDVGMLPSVFPTIRIDDNGIWDTKNLAPEITQAAAARTPLPMIILAIRLRFILWSESQSSNAQKPFLHCIVPPHLNNQVMTICRTYQFVPKARKNLYNPVGHPGVGVEVLGVFPAASGLVVLGGRAKFGPSQRTVDSVRGKTFPFFADVSKELKRQQCGT